MSQNIYRHQNKQVLLDDKPWQIRMIRLHQPLEYGRKHKYLLFFFKKLDWCIHNTGANYGLSDLLSFA
jgi:hypothetical protein